MMNRRVFDYFIGGVALFAFAMLLVEGTSVRDRYPLFFQVVNLSILLIFATDVIVRFWASPDKWDYLKHKWFDGIVFLPLIQYLPAVQHPDLFVVVRQSVIAVMLISRSRRARKLIQLLSLKPAQAMILGFLAAIGVGSVLLMLPIATVTGDRTSLVDAIFTATSAVCVTGLIVQDTATYFSRFGQLVILGLIQAGGLGIMTFSVVLAVFLRKRMDIRQRAAMQNALDYDSLDGVRQLIKFIILMTFGFELVGAVALFIGWQGRFDTLADTAYHAGFHAVSAFCNAGFSTFSDSLMSFHRDLLTNAVVCGLIVVGGLGFTVIRDVRDTGRVRLFTGRKGRKLRVQTRAVLTVSLSLIVVFAGLLYVTERPGLLQGQSLGTSILLSVFQSVSARTAGFNTIDMARLSSATLFLTIILMFIGASPGSTGGGIKTTTVSVLLAAVEATLKNKSHTELYQRTIPQEVVQKALIVLCVSLMIVLVFTTAMFYVEQKPFVAVLFETISAFGTVGLSMGITSQLTLPGKLLITVLMFIGRLGPLTIAYAMIRSRPVGRYKLAEERIMIG